MYIRIFSVLVLLSFASCQKTPGAAPELTQEQLNKKVDSIMATKSQAIEAEARNSLRLRLKIEVKPKVDSILMKAGQPNKKEL